MFFVGHMNKKGIVMMIHTGIQWVRRGIELSCLGSFVVFASQPASSLENIEKELGTLKKGQEILVYVAARTGNEQALKSLLTNEK
jgi:hypothetical protein